MNYSSFIRLPDRLFQEAKMSTIVKTITFSEVAKAPRGMSV